VRTVDWTQPAIEDFEAFLDLLDGQDERVADRAEQDIRADVAGLVDHPGLGHVRHWPGLLEWSATHWRKIIVYREVPNGLRVIALLDARQDLSAIDLSEV
jgi:plasmid stabilization system protein ParE